MSEDDRNEKELKENILPLLTELKFYKDRCKEMSEKDWIEILKRVKYECFEPGESVFHQGDYGDKFYLILKGNVQVSINTLGPLPKINTSP